MKEGWIKLHRQIEENEFYFSERFTKAQAWIDLLLLAGHKERIIWIRGVQLRLKPGELAYSQLTLAERWKWNFKTVKKFLTDLEKCEMVETKFSNVTTVISIKNWDKYQVVETKTETKTETNKNDKNGNKLIAAVRSLITGEYQEKELYSIVGKFKGEFGADELRRIIGGCVSRGNEFSTPGNLAAYLQTIKNKNGSENGVPKSVAELPYLT